MFFLMLLLFGAVIWAVGLLLLKRAQKGIFLYSALSILFVIVGLVVFSLLSAWTGIIPLEIGDGSLVRYSVSFPYGYLAKGGLGLSVLCIGLLAIISPLLAAWITNRQVTFGTI